jgi:carbon storage regulator
VLVLTRKASQSIVIGTDIIITVLDVHRDQVRIGIQAPKSVDVHRQEVFEALQQANREAAESARGLTKSDGLAGADEAGV